MDAAELRAMQAPLKERYKSTPEAARKLKKQLESDCGLSEVDNSR